MIAESEAQRAALWRLREEHSEAQKREGASVKNDVSVPVSRVPELIRRASAACLALMPGMRAWWRSATSATATSTSTSQQPVGADADAFLAHNHEIMDAVGAVVRDLDGSFSAEHGVGRLKPYMMPTGAAAPNWRPCSASRRALDPRGLMNPGKVLPA